MDKLSPFTGSTGALPLRPTVARLVWFSAEVESSLFVIHYQSSSTTAGQPQTGARKVITALFRLLTNATLPMHVLLRQRRARRSGDIRFNAVATIATPPFDAAAVGRRPHRRHERPPGPEEYQSLEQP
jgi:hypothetical protein